MKIEKNEKLFLEIHISSDSVDEFGYSSFYNFEVYETNPCANQGRTELSKEEDLFMKGFVRFDGCINFEFNQEGCLLHSCGLFDSFNEKLKWVSEILENYID